MSKKGISVPNPVHGQSDTRRCAIAESEKDNSEVRGSQAARSTADLTENMTGFLRLKRTSDLFPTWQEEKLSGGISLAPDRENNGVRAPSPQVHSGGETCRLCLQSCPTELEFNTHVYKHMALPIALTLQATNLKCDLCGKSFPNIPTLAKHKGLAHSKALDTYRHLIQSLGKIPFLQNKLAASFQCNLCTSTALTTIGLLEHITTEHYFGLIGTYVKKLRKFMLTPDILCPFSECQRPVESFKELIIHVGVDHMKVLENYLMSIKGSFAFQVLDLFYHSMLTELKCPIHTSTCGESFMSKTELYIHVCESHFQTELGRKFAFNSKPIDNSKLRKCNLCRRDFTMMDGAIHFGMGHRVLEAMTNEFGIFVSVQGGGGGENILGSYSRCIEEAVIDAVPSASTTNQLMLPSKSAKKPTDSKSIRVESEDESVLWSFSCPKCNHRVHFSDYNPPVSMRLATHYFQHHRALHNNTCTLTKDRDCLLCCRSFESSGLMVSHFQLRHLDVLLDLLLATLPEQNLSKYLNMGRKKTSENSTLDLYSKFLDYAKKRLDSPDRMEPRFIHSFLESSKSTLKLDKNRLFSLLQLISDCHVPLTNGKRLITASIFFWCTRSAKMQGAHLDAPNADSQQESRLCITGEFSMNPSFGQSREENSPGGTLTQGHNLEKPLTCQRCRMDFPGVVHLVNHIKNSNHEGAVLRCKFCVKFSFRVTGTPAVEAHLSAHWFSSEHLHNRFVRLFQKKKSFTSIRTSLGLWCEMCGGEIDFSGGHLKSQEHRQRHAILLLWMEFCDLRRICPVTCEIREVEFFVKVTFPKTRSNKQNKFDFFINQVLEVCANLHQYVHNESLYSTNEIDKLWRSLFSSESDSQLPNFICFLCSIIESNSQEFLDHLKSEDHKRLCSQAVQYSFLKCEPCNSLMPSTTSFCLHLFTSRHLECTWHYNNTPDFFTSSEPEQLLNFCELCSQQVNINDDEHVSSEVQSPYYTDHQTRLRCAEKYLLYCNEHRLRPAEIGIEALNNFIEGTFRKTPRCRFAEADVVLEVLSALHKSINGSKVKMVFEILNLYKTCRATTNFRRQLVFKENIYDVLNEDQLDQVLMCPECHIICSYATGMVFHAFISHQISTADLIKMNEFTHAEEVFQCPTCKKNLRSPLSFALHFDMHHSEKGIDCQACKKKYDSPAVFYSKDGCGSDRTINNSDRDNIINGIKSFIARSDCKEKKILEPSFNESNENSTHSLRLLVSACSRSKLETNREIGAAVSNDPRLQPSVAPPCVRVEKLTFASDKRKEPEATSPQRENSKAKRSCFSSPPQSPTSLFVGYNPKKSGFCLDCENCQVEGCDHLGHQSRKVFADIVKHSTSHNHENFEVLADCGLSKTRVYVSDLLNSKEYHEKILLELSRTKRKKTNCNCSVPARQT